MKQALRDSYLSVLTFIAVAFAVALGWGFAFSRLVPAILYGETNELRPPIAAPGRTILLCRDMTFTRHAVIHVSRALTRKLSDGRMMRIDFGDASIAREPGEVRQCRPLTLPADVPPGRYQLETTVEYVSFPFWRVQGRAPDVAIEIL